jgi:hypothetical protein
MSEAAEFARPVMRRCAGLHPNETGGQFGEVGEHLTAPQAPLLDNAAARVNAVNLEDMLGQIEADGRYLHGG